MAEEENILFSGEEPSQEQILNYLKGELPEEQAHQVEEQMAASSFVNDAVEGLQTFSSHSKLDRYVRELNKNLHQHTDPRKQRRDKRNMNDLQWILFSVVLILLLCLLAYAVISIQKEREKEHSSPAVPASQTGNVQT